MNKDEKMSIDSTKVAADMVDIKDIRQEIFNILAEESDFRPEDIVADTTIKSLELASLDIIEIVMNLEKKYKLGRVPDRMLGKVQTVGDLVNCVSVALERKNGMNKEEKFEKVKIPANEGKAPPETEEKDFNGDILNHLINIDKSLGKMLDKNSEIPKKTLDYMKLVNKKLNELIQKQR